jgi:4-azaleucine resistance transporter AzlC
MTTTITEEGRASRLRRPIRPRNHEIRPASSVHDPGGDAREGPKKGLPKAAFVSGAKAIAPVALALMPLGLAFGATATGSGLSMPEALGMSVFVFSGAAQLAALPLLSAGASVAVVVLTVLVINIRMVLYSASLAPHFRGLGVGWKGLLSYIITDQAYAATITRFDEGRVEEPDKRWYYLGAALPVGAVWLSGTVLGVFVGSWVPEGWSLDFVLPLIFIALAVPAVKDHTTGAAALCAGASAVFAATMSLNLGLITAALVGVCGGLIAEGVSERRER